ncbi:hypothetical protein [Clostridium sp. UBA1652]|uniref:hypothetical protein n=1 Tax=Clostridium sp. UBA1652 TaxID=1946348 RepID=UPI0025795E66|nr:hypothetical protein [Clostridium sp. UBA1652]
MINTNKHKLYLKAFDDALIAYEEAFKDNKKDLKEIIRKIIVYGVKSIITKEQDDSQSELNFIMADGITQLMGSLTPGEFISLYPIKKEYDGDKSGFKDYYYTKAYMDTLNADEPIGQEIINLLWEYHNIEIKLFNVKLLGYMSDVRVLNGGRSLEQEFAGDMGLKTIRMYKGNNGKQFMINENGKSVKINNRPSYIKIIK